MPHDTPRESRTQESQRAKPIFPDGDITRCYTCAAWVTMSRPYNSHYVKWLPFGFLFCARLSLGVPFSDHAGNYLLSRSGVRSGATCGVPHDNRRNLPSMEPRAEDYHPTSRKPASLGKTCRVCAVPLRHVVPIACWLFGYPRILSSALGSFGRQVLGGAV